MAMALPPLPLLLRDSLTDNDDRVGGNGNNG